MGSQSFLFFFLLTVAQACVYGRVQPKPTKKTKPKEMTIQFSLICLRERFISLVIQLCQDFYAVFSPSFLVLN